MFLCTACRFFILLNHQQSVIVQSLMRLPLKFCYDTENRPALSFIILHFLDSHTPVQKSRSITDPISHQRTWVNFISFIRRSSFFSNQNTVGWGGQIVSHLTKLYLYRSTVFSWQGSPSPISLFKKVQWGGGRINTTNNIQSKNEKIQYSLCLIKSNSEWSKT